jgi:hypothetical protein
MSKGNHVNISQDSQDEPIFERGTGGLKTVSSVPYPVSALLHIYNIHVMCDCHAMSISKYLLMFWSTTMPPLSESAIHKGID